MSVAGAGAVAGAFFWSPTGAVGRRISGDWTANHRAEMFPLDSTGVDLIAYHSDKRARPLRVTIVFGAVPTERASDVRASEALSISSLVRADSTALISPHAEIDRDITGRQAQDLHGGAISQNKDRKSVV